jgi:hypothetical protein
MRNAGLGVLRKTTISIILCLGVLTSCAGVIGDDSDLDASTATALASASHTDPYFTGTISPEYYAKVSGAGSSCPGIIIDTAWVLTKASCVFGVAANTVTITVGEGGGAGTTVTTTGNSFTVYTSYDSSTGDYDLAALELASTLTISADVQAFDLDAAEGVTRFSTVRSWITTTTGI